MSWRLLSRIARWVRLSAGATLWLALAGCAKTRAYETSEKSCPCESPEAIDSALMAWLSKARTLHHLADLAESEGSTEKAEAPLEQLVTGAKPTGNPPEMTEVLADTYARLAELRAQRGDFAQAERDLDLGLTYAPGKTYFRGHLLEVRGLVYQKQSQALEKAGHLAEAQQARGEASRASLEAVRLQDEVIKSSLGDAGPTK
jgi:hypothetical protein